VGLRRNKKRRERKRKEIERLAGPRKWASQGWAEQGKTIREFWKGWNGLHEKEINSGSEFDFVFLFFYYFKFLRENKFCWEKFYSLT
jgi:hypothetical protein